MKKLAALFLLFCGGALAQEPGVAKPLEDALLQARQRHQPVLVEFHAPWCHSCYYMARNVLTGREWLEARSRAVHVEFDVDQRDGNHWMQAWNIKAIPSYVVLDENGRELGRILGEASRDEFYGRLYTLMGQQAGLQALQGQVNAATPQALAAAREVLRTHLARDEGREAIAWVDRLPAPVLTAMARDKESSLLIARLEAARAAQNRDNAACLKAEGAVLASTAIGCERPYEMNRFLACAGDLAPEPRRALLREQTQRLQQLFDRQVIAEGNRCADERSVTLGLAGLYEDIGDVNGRSQVLAAAIDNARARLKDDLKGDRALADDLRAYLERAGKTEELEAWLERLASTWPEDYVYAQRYAKFLAAQGRHEQALAWYEKSAALTYGINKLRVTRGQAESLIALNRTEEARQLIQQVLQANGPWFPEETAKLRALINA